jgi:hypothetical protein
VGFCTTNHEYAVWSERFRNSEYSASDVRLGLRISRNDLTSVMMVAFKEVSVELAVELGFVLLAGRPDETPKLVPAFPLPELYFGREIFPIIIEMHAFVGTKPNGRVGVVVRGYRENYRLRAQSVLPLRVVVDSTPIRPLAPHTHFHSGLSRNQYRGMMITGSSQTGQRYRAEYFGSMSQPQCRPEHHSERPVVMERSSCAAHTLGASNHAPGNPPAARLHGLLAVHGAPARP